MLKELANVENRIKHELRQEINDLPTEMHGGFGGVGEAIEELNQRMDEQNHSLAQCVQKLERKAATH